MPPLHTALRLGTIRRLCTIRALQNGPRFQSLPPSLQAEASRVEAAIRDARQATEIAAAEASDDYERDEAKLKVKRALHHYVQLAARADPPVRLTPYGEVPHNARPADNHVVRLLRADVRHMKEALCNAHRQRVWIGWWGWF